MHTLPPTRSLETMRVSVVLPGLFCPKQEGQSCGRTRHRGSLLQPRVHVCRNPTDGHQEISTVHAKRNSSAQLYAALLRHSPALGRDRGPELYWYKGLRRAQEEA